MRRCAIAAAVFAAAISGVALAAEPAAQVSSQDYLKAIQQTGAPAQAAPAGAAPSPGQDGDQCAPGTVQDEDGLCAPVVKNTRGFSLATSPSSAPQAAPAATAAARPRRAPAARVATAAPRRASVPAQPSLLGNLLITFKLGSSELTEQGRANAAAFAAALRDPSVGGTRFEIAGHTDASGSADANRTLSQARANAVKAFLVSQGVDASRLETHGYGSSDLALPSEPRAAANRRVEARRLN